MFVSKELESAQSRDLDVRASKHARCHWDTSEPIRSRRLGGCALPSK
jgi:hypothetical protein